MHVWHSCNSILYTRILGYVMTSLVIETTWYFTVCKRPTLTKQLKLAPKKEMDSEKDLGYPSVEMVKRVLVVDDESDVCFALEKATAYRRLPLSDTFFAYCCMLVFCFFINLKFVKKFDGLTQSAFFGNRYEPTTTLGAGPRLHKRLNYPFIFYNNVCQLIVWKTVDASDIFHHRYPLSLSCR